MTIIKTALSVMMILVVAILLGSMFYAMSNSIAVALVIVGIPAVFLGYCEVEDYIA
jgi:hypothetical protein